jgi:hypothetical protein
MHTARAAASYRWTASGLLLATNDGLDVWRSFVPRMLGGDAELADYADARRGIYRAAAFAAGALTGCFFLAPAAAAPPWDAVKALFEADARRGRAPRAALGTLRRRARELRADRLRLLQRGACRDPRRHSVRRRDECRKHRGGAAGRHQLRVVSARAQADCDGGSSPLGSARIELTLDETE